MKDGTLGLRRRKGMAGKLEQLSVDKDGNIKRGKTKPKKSKNSKKNNILAKNKAKGRAFEKQEFAQFKSTYSKAQEQVTIKTASSRKIRLDAIGLDSNNKVVISEYKSSDTAPLRTNQKKAFNEILSTGAVVVGKGKGIFSKGYKIPPDTNINIIRP